MNKLTARRMQLTAWGISAAVVVIAVVAWGQSFDWQLFQMSIYHIFPLFGLLAFSVMWSHYMVSAIRQYTGVKAAVLHDYFEITSAVVLTTILLHPGLLAWQLRHDGLGWPPGSYKEFIGPALYGFVLLGATAWVIFLAYELRRVFRTRPWWRFVQYGSDIAMFLVFIHALSLGGQLQGGWFRGVWYFYGVTLVVALAYTYGLQIRQAKIAKKS